MKKEKYSEYHNHKINLENQKRNFSVLPHVCEYGYITGCVGLPLADRIFFQNKLELCLRISCCQDKLVHVINEKEYKTSYPHFLVKPPKGSYVLKEITQRDVFYILYPPETMDYFQKAGIITENLCWEVELTPSVSNLVNLLKEMMDHSTSFGFADQVDLRCFQLVQEFVLMNRKKESQQSMMPGNLNRIISYFHMHYSDKFSLDELIEVNGFSRSSFFRNWTRYYNIPPAKYILNLRLDEAKRLLTETNSSIEEIAMILKFSSATYFCAVFKKLYGCTPLQYRSKMKID